MTPASRRCFGDRKAARLQAALTLLTYVVCGLTLTAHIAFADHHCEIHCHPDPFATTTSLSADGHCHFDHHSVEEHHEEAVKPGNPSQGLAPAAAPPAPVVLDVDDPDRVVVAPTAPAPCHRPALSAPARAPPAS